MDPSIDGNRLPDGAAYELHVNPGDYALSFHRTSVTMNLPNGEFIRVPCSDQGQLNSGTWGLEEHGDGTISLTPSIFLNRDHPGQPRWHGYLTKGKFQGV